MDLLKRICLLVFPLSVLLMGCCRIFRQSDHAPYHVVTQVHILYKNEAVETQRTFYREENIRHILDYLRYIDPYGIPQEDPGQAQGRTYVITLIYSDGFKQFYEQRADRFFRIGDGAWKRIEPHKAQYLSGLYGMMPSDQPPIDEPAPPLICPEI